MKNLAVIFAFVALFSFAGIADAPNKIQDIVDSAELVEDPGDGYNTYTIDTTSLQKITIEEVEKLAGAPLENDIKDSLGDVYLVLPEKTVLINVVFYDSCVDSQMFVEAVDLQFNLIPNIQQNEQFKDVDSCPD